jgi:excisionase family DNA binding protein
VLEGNTALAASPAAPFRLLVTVAEAADALGLCRSIIYELLLAGELPSVKIGRARRIPVAALEAFVERRLVEAACS